MEKNELELDLRIDEDALDLEWLEQPDLMRKYTRLEADAKEAMHRAEDELALVEADLDKQIRVDPEAFDVTVKVTEKVVASVILEQPEYQVAKKKVSETRHEANVLRGVVESVRHRKFALENLVQLHGQNYFAGPSVPRDLRKEKQQREERAAASNKKVKMKRKQK